MYQELTIFSGSTGINNRVDPVRLAFDSKRGVQEFASAVNVLLDSTGRPRRRRGFTATPVTESCHSLWADNDFCFVVTGGYLCRVHPDFSTTQLVAVNAISRMDYERVFNQVYFANGITNGIITNGNEISNWVAGDYVGPNTTRTFSDPPVGHLLCVFNGVMYVAVDNNIFHSEPMAYSWFDKARNLLPFTSRIRMVEGMVNGLWVSDDHGIYWLPGTKPKELGFDTVADYPAIEGTVVRVNRQDLGSISEFVSGRKALVFNTNQGICAAGTDGAFINLTKDRLEYPSGFTGAGLLMGDHYITTIAP